VPYDIRFQISTPGKDDLAQIPGIVEKLSQSTKASSADLRVFEAALRADVAAGSSLSEALQRIAATSNGGFEGLARLGKEAAALAASQQQAARGAHDLAAANEKTATSANAATAATDKLTQAQRNQASGQRFGGRDFAAQPFGSNVQADGRIQELAYAENARRTQAGGRLQAIAEAENIRRAEQELKKAEQAANATSSAFLRLGQSAGIVDGQVGSLLQGTGSLAGGLGAILSPATLAAGAIVALGVVAVKTGFDLVQEAGKAEEAISNLADRIGLSVGEAQKLQAAAHIAGVDISALEAASRLLGEALENPTTTGKKAADALHKLGIETIGLKGGLKETGPIVLQALNELSKIPETATRLALANETLGRSAKVLQPLIKDYENLKKVVSEIHIGEDVAGTQKLLEADDAIDKLELSWEKFKRSLAVELSPVVIPVIAKITAILQNPILQNVVGDAGTALVHTSPVATAIEGLLKFDEARTEAGKPKPKESVSAAISFPTSGEDFKRRDDQTKEALEEQLHTAKAAAAKLRPDLRSDSIDAETRAKETAEYNKQQAAIQRLEASLESLNKAKHLPAQQAQEAINLRAEAEKAEAGELTGHKKINVEIAARIEKLREENKLNAEGREQIERIRVAQHARLDQELQISQAQNRRSVAATVIDQSRRLDKARSSGEAEIALAQGRNQGEDEAGIQAAFDAKIREANAAFQDASREIAELRKQRDERQQIKPDQKQLGTDNKAIDQAAIKAAGDAALALYEAQKARILELTALDRKRFEDAASAARNARLITDATTHADIEDRKSELSRQSRLVAINSDSGPGAELDTLRKQLDLRRQAAQLDLDERQRNINAQRKEQEDLGQRFPARQKEVEEQLARLRVEEIQSQRGFERELGDERIEIELRIAEIRKKGEEEYKQFVVGVVNSGLTGGSATSDFLRNFGHKIFDQIVSNVAGLTFDTVKKVAPKIPGQTDAEGKPTTLGKVLAGTPLGDQEGAAKRAQQDLLKAQADHQKSVQANSTSTDRNTRATEDLNRTLSNAGGEPSSTGTDPNHRATLDANTESNNALNDTMTRIHRDNAAQQNDPNDPTVRLTQSLDRFRYLLENPSIFGGASRNNPFIFHQNSPERPGSTFSSQIGQPANPQAGEGIIALPLSVNSYSTDRNTAALNVNTSALINARSTAIAASGGGGGAVNGSTYSAILRSLGKSGVASGSEIGSAADSVWSERPSLMRDSPNYIGNEPASGTSGGVLDKLSKALGVGSSQAPYSGLNGVLSGLGHTGDLQGIFTGVGKGPGGVGAQNFTTSERIGAGIGTAGVVAGGVMGAIGGFSKGGARGALQGTGSILGTAAVLDPEPISKAVLAAGAMVTGIISAILPDPHLVRQQAIAHELATNQYLAPEALNLSTDMHGNFTDTDQFGKVRSSPFRSAPQVVEPYIYTHGSNYVSPVPGSVLAPFTPSSPAQTQAPTVINNYNGPVHNAPAYTGNINAIDTQSMSEALMKHSDAVGAASAANLKNGDSEHSRQIRYLVG